MATPKATVVESRRRCLTFSRKLAVQVPHTNELRTVGHRVGDYLCAILLSVEHSDQRGHEVFRDFTKGFHSCVCWGHCVREELVKFSVG